MLLDPGVIFLHCVYAYFKLPHFSGVMRGLSCETVVSRDMRHYIIILYIIMRHYIRVQCSVDIMVWGLVSISRPPHGPHLIPCYT